MANSKSAEKRIDINKRNRLQNKYYKSSVRSSTKLFLEKLEPYKTSKNESERIELLEILKYIFSMIDKGTKKNIFPKNTAKRKKKNLLKKLRIAN